MKAQIIQQGKLVYTDVPLPELGPDDVLLGVRVCRIDPQEISRAEQAEASGVIPGAHYWGVVREMGSSVENLSIGDRVGIFVSPPGGKTGSGSANSASGDAGSASIGGGLAEYIRVPASACLPIPDDMDDYTAAMLGPLAEALRTSECTGLKMASSCVVIGEDLAPLYAALARARGLAPVIAVGRKTANLQAAVNLGADYVVNATQASGVAESILKLLGGAAADCVIVTPDTGFDTESVSDVLHSGTVRPQGNLAAAADDADEPDTARAAWNRACVLLDYDRIDPKPLFSMAVPLQEVGAAIEEMKRRPELLQVFAVPGLAEKFYFPWLRTAVEADIGPAK